MKKRALSGLLKLDGPLLSILSLLIAIVISGVIMAVCGYNPIEAFGAILAGSFGSQRAIVQTLTQATPLIFTGLAFAFAKKASLINLGAEGQLYMGALASAAVGMLDLGADIAKLAVMPRNRADAARLLLATAQAAAQRPGKALITMSMGRDGAVTRYCGGAFGSAATFGTLSAASAPGQPPVNLLKEKLISGEDL